MVDDDLLFFACGSTLVVSLVRRPEIRAWQAQMSTLGVRLVQGPGFGFEVGVTELHLKLEVADDSPLPNAPRLAARGVLPVDLTMTLSETPGGSWEHEIEHRELAQLRRCRWEVRLAPPPEAGDLLPTALAVGLVGEDGGVVQHAGLDQAVFTGSFGPPPARLLLAKLLWYSDNFDLAYGDVDRKATFPDCAVAPIARLVSEAAPRHFGQAIDRAGLEQYLFRVIDDNRVGIEVREPQARVTSWLSTLTAGLHMWLLTQLKPTRSVDPSAWNDLVQRIEQLLTRTAEDRRCGG